MPALFEGLSASFGPEVDKQWKKAFEQNGGLVVPSKRRKIAEFYITAGEEDEFASDFVRDFKPAVGAAWIADSVSKHALQNPFTYLFVTQDLKDETQPQPGAIVPVGPNLSQQGGNVGTDVPEREVRHVGSIKLGYSRESEELWLQEQLDLAREGSPGRNQSQTQSQGQSQRSERNRFGRLASRQQGSSQATDRERDMTRARARKRPNWDLEEDSADRANRLAVLAEERQAAAPAGDGETVNDGPREETEPEVDHGPTVERDANVGDAEQAEPRRSPRKRSGKGKERASPLINPEERPEPPRSIMKKRRQAPRTYTFDDFPELDESNFGADVRPFLPNVGGDRVIIQVRPV